MSWKTIAMLREGLGLSPIAERLRQSRREEKAKKFLMNQAGITPLSPEEKKKLDEFKNLQTQYSFKDSLSSPLPGIKTGTMTSKTKGDIPSSLKDWKEKFAKLKEENKIPELQHKQATYKAWEQAPVDVMLKLLPNEVQMKYSGLKSKGRNIDRLKQLLQIEKSLGDYLLYSDLSKNEARKVARLRRDVLLQTIKEHPALKSALVNWSTPVLKKTKKKEKKGFFKKLFKKK